jgi:hypothetical protein
MCPVQALDQKFLHILGTLGGEWSTYLLVVRSLSRQRDVADKDISKALKWVAAALGYPSHGIPIDCIDAHSLQIGGTNALSLSLAGCSDQQIQKMGHWVGETFKESI